jgi:hypothetical protein
MKSRAPELAFGNHKNIRGRHWFHSCGAKEPWQRQILLSIGLNTRDEVESFESTSVANRC